METDPRFSPAPPTGAAWAQRALGSEGTPTISAEALARQRQSWHAVRIAELRLARARLDHARQAALLGLHYDADEYDRLIMAYRQARRVALAQPHVPAV